MLLRFLTAVFAVCAAHPVLADTRLLRFPDIHGDRVVFTYAGDLWRAPAGGGQAVRLTSHPGLELFPRFSPDGTQIAFTAQYGGDEQVYVMPAEGGEPRQLTFYPARGPLPDRWGYDNQVYGWSPDGERVLFRSLRDTYDLGDTVLYTVAADGGLPEPLPMPRAGSGVFSPDGTAVVYSPLFRDFRTWKRYEGGWAQDLYVFELDGTGARRVTEHPRTDRDPMWIGDAIYFVSDRDGTLNLYRHDAGTGGTEQLTRHRDWDVRWPGYDEGRIVYEHGGRLRIYDVASGADRGIEITVPAEALGRRTARRSVAAFLQDATLSPDGRRVLAVARGDLFDVPAEKGVTRSLTHSSDAHDREPAWSPDGESIAWISDASGEEELWVMPAVGGEARQVTRESRTRYYAPRWSPDGERVALSDKDGRLLVVEVASGRTTAVADDPYESPRDHAWSPDGRYLAYSRYGDNQLARVYVYGIGDGQTRAVTPELFHAESPAWDPEGRYLYFLSMREFHPQIAANEWNYALNRPTGIYALALSEDAEPLFPPENDTLGEDDDNGEEKDTGEETEEAGADALPEVRIDFEGLDRRVMRVPVEADNYASLHATAEHLVYARYGAFYYGREPARETTVMVFSLKDREAEARVEGLERWTLSADGSRILTLDEGALAVYEVEETDEEPGAVPLDGLVAEVSPEEEYRQIFDEVWRRFRDHFYVANMHGYDWERLGEQYRALLPWVAHRADLNYVIGEMIGELNVSHAYIAGGDLGGVERRAVALPGARFELDADAGRYRIARIFEGQNEEPLYRSPLTAVGADVEAGDYLLAINGQPLAGDDNPYDLLQVAADRPLELTVAGRADGRDARDVLIEPLTTETNLIYLDWVLGNYRKVTEATDGRVGYLHVPDMGANGLREFVKWFYPQVRREALVIDVRGNGGGNVSQMLINRLNRTLLGMDYPRNWDLPGTYPEVVFTGPMVTLINQTSASDGDIFPWMFRQAGLGPLIGMRTWGGVIGITDRGPLIDGGQVYVPEFGNADADGQWAVEGYGVEPDIEVDNDPLSLLEGRDPQLERGLAELERLMETRPPTLLPEAAPAPVKTP